LPGPIGFRFNGWGNPARNILASQRDRRLVLNQLYSSGKPVAPLGNRLDVISSIRGRAQIPSKDRNVRREIALFHEGIRPHGAHQILPGHQLPAPLDQNQEHFYSLRLQGYNLLAGDQKMGFPIETELAELVNDFWPVR
jgi:hypothetical protein